MYVLPSFLVDDVNNLVPGVNYIEKVVKDIEGPSQQSYEEWLEQLLEE